ncbi:AraC family transcriptional regulator [Bifidobacterium lemurum]|uniref:AraC family transcriptional regulator n=1 Tax=Bifidobacterium lemurum TaxID=1603886 RepID=A0A261FW25_9BIFI|nr:AraC family transcriptional regulator [Bifidobacterium lemurum]OZG63379.1 AraC family transcriptional regulator [Bifidobacterium lemurum]QOL34286.1 helix-turn-helix transcriptional regulator [Bifidobacterium lemurum]
MERSAFNLMRPSRHASGLRFACCGIAQEAPDLRFPGVAGSRCSVVVVVEGRLELFCGGVRYRLGVGDGFVIRPDAAVVCRPYGDGDSRCLLWGFDGDAEYYLSALGLGSGHDVFHVRDCRPLLDLTDKGLRHVGGGVVDELRLHALAHEFVVALSGELEVNDALARREVAASRSEAVDLAMRYIAANYAGRCSVAEVAAYCGVDRSHLSREFRHEVGMTVKECVDRLRIAKACDLLAFTAMSVSAVSRACGYGSADAFEARFKSAWGMTPGSFRRKADDRFT